MKNISTAFALVLTLSLSQYAVTEASETGRSTPVTYTAPLAPVLDATQPSTPIAMPIFAADIPGYQPDSGDGGSRASTDQAASKKQSVTDKFKELDRRRSSWFKRTFGGG